MKKFVTSLIFVFFVNGVFAQYTNISTSKCPDQMSIVQVDYKENSTLVFMKCISQEDFDYCNINDKTYAEVNGDNRKFHLINSINMPISSEAVNKYMLFDYVGQIHYFVFEFEKLPKGAKFNIYEDKSNSNAFNFYNINVDTLQCSEYMDIDKFISSTPVKEMGRYMKDGMTISYIKANGVIITTFLEAVRQYGKYYTVNVDIQNFSGNSILFDLDKVTATGYIKSKKQPLKSIPMSILSSDEYDKKVARKQAWNNFWVALGEGMAASNAGYSTSSTTYSGNSYTSGYASAYGYMGNTYGYANAYGSAYTTTYGKSNTVAYNGAAAYAAQQQANANYERFANGQYEIRQQLNEGYIKNNTIPDRVEYSGFFNIEYKKLQGLNVVFTINGVQYPMWYY